MGKKRVALVTGERSGELYAGLISRAIKKIDNSIEVRGTCDSVPGLVNMKDIGVVGITSAVANLHRFWRIFRQLRRSILEWMPDVLVFIDFPDFNLFLGRSLIRCKVKFPMLYFSPPTVWAWRSSRAKIVRDICKQVFTLFEFEADFYKKYGIDAVWEGHPLVDVISQRSFSRSRENKSIIIGLLPGSRRVELSRHIPVFMDAAREIYKKCAECQFLLSLVDDSFTGLVDKSLPIKIVKDAYELMASSDFLIGASGTVTVEAAILGKPMVVAYRSSWLDKFIYDHFVHTEFVSMTNIVMGRKVYPELLQKQVTPSAISRIILEWIGNAREVNRIKRELQLFKERLGSPGVMERIAKRILVWIK